MVVFMEKRTPKNSTNSSKPSSQTPKDDTAITHPGANSKGNQHNGIRCANTRTVETVHASPVTQCETCGEDLSKTPCQGVERRTRIDIIFEKVVTHVDAEIRQCPQCRTRNKGPFPADMAGPVQYGPGIRGYVMNLLIAQMISLKRVQQSIQTLIGQILSEATILKYVMQLHHTLAAWEQSVIEQLLQMPAMHVDETSLRVDRKNHWIHVCPAGHITYKFLH
ncbi:IS66 family transposase, partial [Thiolapillus sp.]|uniref:IS66 family transposase n=1 Tax=Thiolapillus sp. TaxID=2017437 RepID=UPI003AF6D1E7